MPWMPAYIAVPNLLSMISVTPSSTLGDEETSFKYMYLYSLSKPYTNIYVQYIINYIQ
jgi:hypothetical protein